VLVADVTDDLLREVLERDDPGGPAVLVDDDGHLQAGLTQAGEQGVAVERLGHRGHALHQVTQHGRVALGDRHAEGLLDVHHAEHGVEVTFVDGEAGEPAAAGERDEIGDGVVGVEGLHAHPRCHEVLRHPVGETQ